MRLFLYGMHFRYRLPHCDQNWCTILVDSAAAVTSQRTDKVQGFANKDFQRYKVIHTDGDRRFGCAACGKRFRTWNALNDHVRLHSRANPYQCTVCDKCFRTHGHLPGEYTKDVDRIRVPCAERVSHSRAALPHTCTHTYRSQALRVSDVRKPIHHVQLTARPLQTAPGRETVQMWCLRTSISNQLSAEST